VRQAAIRAFQRAALKGLRSTHVSNDWSRRAQLQRIVGERGTVQSFAASASPAHRAVGWYLRPEAVRDGCDCGYCRAGREGREVFLASSAFLAATLLSRYVDAHPLARGDAV
jgi:hypothetical protein